MYLSDDKLINSPSDLCTYMESPFAAWMERYALIDEEIEVIRRVIAEVQGRIYVDNESGTRKVTLGDILIVAPYNHQINFLKQASGESVKVGTVDKFQGQEAAIVILSMCASNAAESPCGLDFCID